MSAPKVTLRKRLLPSGKVTLYLDFYPAVRNPKTLKLSRREYLGIYLIKSPRTIQDREENAKKLRIAVCSKVIFRQSGFEKGASGRPFQR